MKKLAQSAQAFVRRHVTRLLELRERLGLSEETFHLGLAGLIGVVGALVNLAFFQITEGIKRQIAPAGPERIDVALAWEWWQRLLTPALGGLAAGLILHWGVRLLGVAGQGTTNLLEVIVAGDGRLPFRTSLLRALSSLLSMSSGASIGREGPLANLTASLASKAGQWADWAPYRLRMMVACGAAAGMAAAYNAPIGGAVFAAQIVLGNFSMNLFAPLVVASVVATVVSRSFFGIEPWYRVPDAVEFTRLSQLPWFLLLGVLAGVVGAWFLKSMHTCERIWTRVPWPLPARMCLAGLAVGGLALAYPEVLGNGYTATNRILHETLPLGFLVGVLAAKWLATAITVGAGTVGGVFTPTLFVGAGLGGAFGRLLHDAGYAQQLPGAAFALVGMGGLLAATTHSPLLAMILIFEISLNYTLMPPLMVVAVIATLVARRLHPDTVYTEPLRRKGVSADRETDQIGAASQQTVGDLMRQPVPPVHETTAFADIASRFLTSPNNFLPVVDAEGRLVGVVALQDLKGYLHERDAIRGIIAADIMRPPPPLLTPGQRLSEALPILLASELRNIPVVNSVEGCRLVGSVPRAEALGLLSEAIVARTRT